MSAIELPEGTVIWQEGRMACVIVKYPTRKAPDMYIALKQRPIRCIRCGEDIPRTGRGVSNKNMTGRLIDHIRSHDRRATVRRLPSFQFPAGQEVEG